MRRTVAKLAAGASAVVLAAAGGAATYAVLADPSPAAPEAAVTDGSPAASTSGGTVGEVYDHANASVVEIKVKLNGGGEQMGKGGGA